MANPFKVQDRWIGSNHPTYFIADIGANHDGDLGRARELIHMAAEAGADAAKFQHFQASKIVSDYGFRVLGGRQSHQAKWKKSVFQVYQDAEVPHDWTEKLKAACDIAGIHFFSAPYDFDAVDLLDSVGVPAHKIGSGDITWTRMLDRIGRSGKPVFIASGASVMADVIRAMDVLEQHGVPICLMQCNTNYTGTLENIRHVNLNVLKSFAAIYPDVVLGLSDHTPGYATVLGAVALGARAVEKHFTDDKGRDGPDHKFSMDPHEWCDMVDRTRELEAALGSTRKFVAPNEQETMVIQRRCLRAVQALVAGTVLAPEHLVALRPAPVGAVMPFDEEAVIGRRLRRDLASGEHMSIHDVE